MFESLDETIKHDVAIETTRNTRIVKYSVIGVLSIAIFVGLYFALRTLTG